MLKYDQHLLFTEKRRLLKRRNKEIQQESSSSSSSSRLSADYMMDVIERLRYKANRDSTVVNYQVIWRIFNKFLIRLDKRPQTWEDRVLLFCGYLIDCNKKSSTIKSYISAIKWILKTDGYDWDQNKIVLGSITKACKLKNDIVKTRLPISCKLLELILFEINRIFHKQEYLSILYKTILIVGYYGLFRIGELTQSPHVMLARNVHLATNKQKLLIVLYSSKTHGIDSYPQKIKITGTDENDELQTKPIEKCFCPFQLTEIFLKYRGDYDSDDEQFFVFRDKSPVKPDHVRKVLKECLQSLNLDESLYNCQSLRIGRANDMAKYNYSLMEIRQAGRWKSSAVFKYIRDW